MDQDSKLIAEKYLTEMDISKNFNAGMITHKPAETRFKRFDKVHSLLPGQELQTPASGGYIINIKREPTNTILEIKDGNGNTVSSTDFSREKFPGHIWAVQAHMGMGTPGIGLVDMSSKKPY